MQQGTGDNYKGLSMETEEATQPQVAEEGLSEDTVPEPICQEWRGAFQVRESGMCKGTEV